MSFHNLLYLDKDFISSLYESKFDESPEVFITKSQVMNVGAKLPIFSAGLGSTEAKAYKISTTQMLEKLKGTLKDFDCLKQNLDSDIKGSSYFWVFGIMTVQTSTLENKNGKTEETYFSVKDEFCNDLILLANDDYFASNLSDLIKLTGVVVNVINFKVKALVRIIPAKTSFGGWVAVPLVIREITS